VPIWTRNIQLWSREKRRPQWGLRTTTHPAIANQRQPVELVGLRAPYDQDGDWQAADCIFGQVREWIRRRSDCLEETCVRHDGGAPLRRKPIERPAPVESVNEDPHRGFVVSRRKRLSGGLVSGYHEFSIERGASRRARDPFVNRRLGENHTADHLGMFDGRCQRREGSIRRPHQVDGAEPERCDQPSEIVGIDERGMIRDSERVCVWPVIAAAVRRNPSRGGAVHFTTRLLKQIRQWVLLQLQDGDCTVIFPARIVEQQIMIALISDLAGEVKRVTFAERQFHSVHLR
jgi:hypothetical protein